MAASTRWRSAVGLEGCPKGIFSERATQGFGSSLRLENGESLFARITNSMKGSDDADAREHDYKDNERPDGIHALTLSGAPAWAGKPNLDGRGDREQIVNNNLGFG